MERIKLAQAFNDAETGLHYNVGDMYPRYLEPTAERVAFLREHGVFEEGTGDAFEKPTDKNTVDEIKGYLNDHEIEIPEGVSRKVDLLALITD